MVDAVFKIRNADNTVQFDLDSRLLRVLNTTINTGTTDGSVVVAGVDQGLVVGFARNEPVNGTTPSISQTASGIAWTFPPGVPANERKAVDLDILVF